MKCTACGKWKAREYKTGKLKVIICSECEKKLSWEINHCIPMIWVGPEDLSNRDLLIEDEANKLTREDMAEITDSMADGYWNNDYNGYGELLDEIYGQFQEGKEREMIEVLPKKDLPLHLNDILFKKNRELLETRLKEK